MPKVIQPLSGRNAADPSSPERRAGPGMETICRVDTETQRRGPLGCCRWAGAPQRLLEKCAQCQGPVAAPMRASASLGGFGCTAWERREDCVSVLTGMGIGVGALGAVSEDKGSAWARGSLARAFRERAAGEHWGEMRLGLISLALCRAGWLPFRLLAVCQQTKPLLGFS